MHRRLYGFRGGLHRSYDRLGSKYPLIALWAIVVQSHLVVTVALLGISKVISLNVKTWVVVMIIAQLLAVVESAALLVTAHRILGPYRKWFRAGRGKVLALEAWEALTSLPMRIVGVIPLSRTLTYASMIAALLLVAAKLPPWPALAVMLLSGAIMVSTGILLRYLLAELVLRPVVEDVARFLPPNPGISRTVSLTTRLLVGIPLISLTTTSIIAAYITVGLQPEGQTPDYLFKHLGQGMLIAAGVTGTVSVALAGMMARTFMVPIAALQRTAESISAGNLDTRAPLLGGDEISVLAKSLNTAVDGLRQRNQLEEALGAYIDPVVAERVLDEGTELSAEQRDVSVMFIDVRNFTMFSEQANADHVYALLNEFFGVVLDVVERNGGHVNNFMGDGLLVVFGAPAARELHADAAVAAAIEVAAAVKQQFRGDLNIGVGINSGRVAVGTISGGNRSSFSVIGDVVNTASRVESVTRRTGDVVLITEQTRMRLQRDHGFLRQIDPEIVKGKSDPLSLYSVEAAGTVDGTDSEIADRLLTISQQFQHTVS